MTARENEVLYYGYEIKEDKSSIMCLPEDVISKVLDFLPVSSGFDTLKLSGINRAWRKVVTRDIIWGPICVSEFGNAFLVLQKRFGLDQGYFEFYMRKKRSSYEHKGVLRPEEFHDLACHPPSDAFFENYVWILEIVAVGVEKNLIYSKVVEMASRLNRGCLFTSGGKGSSIVGAGLKLGLDVKDKLPLPLAIPQSSPRSPSPSISIATTGSCCSDYCQGEGEEEEEDQEELLGRNNNNSTNNNNNNNNNNNSETRHISEEEEDHEHWYRYNNTARKDSSLSFAAPELLIRLSVYNKDSQRLACLLSSSLTTERPAIGWQGRHWDGPFTGEGGRPTTWVVIDDSHALRILPIVEIMDWGDKVYLLHVNFDLNICICGESCICTHQSGIVNEDGAWILFHHLFESKLKWY